MSSPCSRERISSRFNHTIFCIHIFFGYNFLYSYHHNICYKLYKKKYNIIRNKGKLILMNIWNRSLRFFFFKRVYIFRNIGGGNFVHDTQYLNDKRPMNLIYIQCTGFSSDPFQISHIFVTHWYTITAPKTCLLYNFFGSVIDIILSVFISWLEHNEVLFFYWYHSIDYFFHFVYTLLVFYNNFLIAFMQWLY